MLVVSAVVAYMVILPSPSLNPSPARVNVGIFYYVWYGAVDSDWRAPKFVDYPISTLGNYSSANSTVIKQQLVWIGELRG